MLTTLGDRLKIARERKGFTQIQVKNYTNINNKTLSGYEKGVSEPDIKTLVTLAKLYEVSYKWLLSGEGSIDDTNDQTSPLEDPELDRKSTRLNSSHVANSYAVFCLNTKTTYTTGT